MSDSPPAASDSLPAEPNSPGSASDFDVIVVGAGMAGLYLLYRLRELGFHSVVIEAADDVGGTWYWNRYPGARCDVESIDYSYSFDSELQRDWKWSERYATQPEILDYLRHVADRHDLRSDIRFGTTVESARWAEDERRWTIRTGDGDQLRCRHYIMATGCLSAPKPPEVKGAESFQGDVYLTGRWPHHEVDFSGKRVAVIGTGSSGIQCIPHIAAQATALTVFQRTPNFAVPAHNGPLRPDKLDQFTADPDRYRQQARESTLGVPGAVATDSALATSADERNRRYEEAWRQGSLTIWSGLFNDLLVDPGANETLAEFVREKIRSIVDDSETANTLCPGSYPILTKRLCLDTDYYSTFNRPNVTLVDLRSEPITTVTESGITTADRSFEFDAIVYATGFDAMTGAIMAVDITGRDGATLAERWADGPRTYLGLMSAGFPNLFFITGPQSPSVLSNMAVSIEQHVEWVTDTLAALRDSGHETIEPTPTAESGWVDHSMSYGDITLFARSESWYTGANVDGKTRVLLPYVGGVGRYRAICDEVATNEYLGFIRSGPTGARANDGVVRRLAPDVNLMLEMIEELGVPPMETLDPAGAREMSELIRSVRPPGPEVAEMIDGTFPAPAGRLEYRLYRPAAPGPHPGMIFFHGGGWVLGDARSDEPLCRDLCVRTGAAILSVDYRHGPEHRFPAAIDDGWAALTWTIDQAESLGLRPDRLMVGGWSAGGNIAAVVAQTARDDGGPELRGQLLITPVTDHDFSRPSYRENADGYVLTTALMRWFWDHYADEGERNDPRASPIRAADLSGLPPAVVVTAEFDPLRDEGEAYATALAEAGVPVEHLRLKGQTHTSIGAVGQLPSTVRHRADIAAAIGRLVGAAAAV